VKIVVCALGLAAAGPDDLKISLEVDAVATSLSMAEDRILAMVGDPKASANLGSSASQKWLREYARLPDRRAFIESYKTDISTTFDTSLVVVSLDDAVPAEPELGNADIPEVENLASLTMAVMSADEMLVVEDLTKEHVYDGNTFLLENGIQFFAAAPIHAPSGEVIGCVSIFSGAPRAFTAADGARLQQKADRLVPLARRAAADAPTAASAIGT
jgi:GAF domain-containing protein